MEAHELLLQINNVLVSEKLRSDTKLLYIEDLVTEYMNKLEKLEEDKHG